jgi:hypothetical protein
VNEVAAVFSWIDANQWRVVAMGIVMGVAYPRLTLTACALAWVITW